MEPPLKILVVDDEESHAEVVAASLEKIGADCHIAHSQADAMKEINSYYFDVIITDLMLERENSGLEILKTAKAVSEESEVIVMTANNSVEIAVEAMRRGAFNYLQKPLDLKQIRTLAEKAGESSRIRRMNLELLQRLDEKFGFGGVIGSSPAMLAVVDRLKRIAPTDATVLIQGETGTGKELFAQAIHQNSPRKSRPFVALNCAALSESILESELFGHIKGAFTDAASDRIGKFEYANGGTLFLDEVGDMPMPTQIKLLRVLENGEITRVGSNDVIKVNVRLLSATNRNLEEAIATGAFRQDLYHRLKVVTLRIPTLQERGADIPILVDHFVKLFAKKYGKTIRGVSLAARKKLLAFDWPGNVRQLRNVAESMVVVDFDQMLDLDDLPEELLGGEIPAILTTNPAVTTTTIIANNAGADTVTFGDGIIAGSEFTMPLRNASAAKNLGNSPLNDETTLAALTGNSLDTVEKLFISETLKVTGGNREEAAKMLGIGERTLYRKIKEYKL
ncbi:MAG: sigma-54 dependent transcriptional regulator [Planctomycetaceae bacterium]|jgi:two-component system response regulator HydG|nr:sigma-54 dependent transcriptional regulator [Planctomycetaceae bacterium]